MEGALRPRTIAVLLSLSLLAACDSAAVRATPPTLAPSAVVQAHPAPTETAAPSSSPTIAGVPDDGESGRLVVTLSWRVTTPVAPR